MDFAQPSRRRPKTTANGNPGSAPTGGFPGEPRRTGLRARRSVRCALVADSADALRVAALLLAALAALPSFAQAQNVYVSNAGQGDRVNFALDAVARAQQFTTGSQPGGYVVGGVELDLTPGGTDAAVTVSLWSDSRNRPAALLHTLTSPVSLVVGLNRFTGTNITLSADTKYHVVVEHTSGTRRYGTPRAPHWILGRPQDGLSATDITSGLATVVSGCKRTE